MKTWFITLPLMCGVGIALAAGVEMDGTANPTAGAPVQQQMAKPKHPPRGDLRYCLDFKDQQSHHPLF